MTDGNARGAARRGFEDELDEVSERPLTSDEVKALRARNPVLSPWRVIGAQVLLGIVAGVLAWWTTGAAPVVWSALYGAATAVVPGALLARGVTIGVRGISPAASGLGVMLWSLMKIGASVLMLLLAPRLIQPLSWPALLAALVLCMQVYWFALLWRGR